MNSLEIIIINLGFFLIGIPAGFYTFLMFRISVNQNKFKWAGALAAITTLCGGSYLTYSASPLNFGIYSIGYFIGFSSYMIYFIKLRARKNKHKEFSGLSDRIADDYNNA